MRIKPEDITIISETSSFKGKLKMPGNVIILGSFTGSIIFEGEMACSGLLTIAKAGTVKGRVAYGALSVELGGLLEAEVFQLESTDTKLIPFQRKTLHSDK
jgi:cytoskeletal protein CcmA (bactofilin family)